MRGSTLLLFPLLGSLAACPTVAPEDVQQLRALHEKVMQAHRESDIDRLLEDEAPDNVVVSRGSVNRPTLAERRAGLGAYLSRTSFQEYRDMIEPVVTVSQDGTLGWVIVQVYARGIQAGEDGGREPLEFTCGWIELYQRHRGRWLRVGNVSNFKE